MAITVNGAGTGCFTDASGQVGIGTASPGSLLEISAANASVYSAIRMTNTTAAGTTPGARIEWANGGTVKSALTANTYGGDFMSFNVGSATNEKMRINSAGNLLIGTTANVGTPAGKFVVSTNSAGNTGIVCRDLSTTYGAAVYFATYLNSTDAIAGFVAHTGAATVNFGTTSDYRLKEDVAPLLNSLEKICRLKPVSYKWKEDKTYGEGFIAHELQEIVPLSVTGEKDAVDTDGKIKPQGVDQSKVVVHLVAAIQELTAKVAALETRVNVGTRA